MAKKQRKYTESFKRDTVQLIQAGDKTVAQISRELDIHESVLHRWKRKYGAPTQAPSQSTQTELETENKRLRGENQRLQQERDILKKAITIFSQQSE